MFRWQHALSLHRISVMAGCAVSAVLGMSMMASGQNQSVTIAKDAIFARKILMATISTNMDVVFRGRSRARARARSKNYAYQNWSARS
jgi:hypothetical protein